jgi:hypothetical protein
MRFLGRTGWILVGVGLLAVGVAAGFVTAQQFRPEVTLPPLSSTATVVKPTPNVLLAIRDLERLESVAFHMERVIDLTEKQSKLFGLVESEDAILLVAAAEVRAGVDLAKMTPSDIVVDAVTNRVRVTLPPAEVLTTALDSERTYVHTRRTGVLAQRRENLETRARQEAERTLTEAALEAGLLTRADQNAARTIADLVRSLGFEEVDVTVRR